ncbi:Myb/SANT-like transcription factor [Elysia marginata]|uniref:Myb/SANT-like transcription factor n=1 Tax=Elysia marginata TaxID=1093978 RepID=A0AAV4HBH0_9GAST|nr:Myb/SANT-like transcription factor [Elysia marginata]
MHVSISRYAIVTPFVFLGECELTGKENKKERLKTAEREMNNRATFRLERVNENEAKETWTKLRNNFAKVLARRKAKNPSGSAASGPFRRWTYEAEMEFLKAHMSHSRVMSSSIRASSSSPAPPTSSVYEASEEHDFTTSEPMPAQTPAREPTPAPATAPTPRPRKSPGPEVVDQAMIAYVNSVTNQTEDPLVMWFKSLVPTLKSLSPDQLLSFQIRTMQDIQRTDPCTSFSSSPSFSPSSPPPIVRAPTGWVGVSM